MDLLGGAPLESAARWAAVSALLGWASASLFGFRPSALNPARADRRRAELDEDFKDGRLGEALDDVQALLRYFPEDDRLLSREAHIYDKLGDFKSESRAYEMAMSVSPDPTESCPEIGRSYVKQGFREKGLDADRRCLAAAPTNSDMRIFYALALERNERWAEARKAFELVLEGAPEYKDARVGLERIAPHLKEARP